MSSKKKIIVSSNSGFCFGVRRALNIAESALKKNSPVYSLGPIIHNPQVVDEFSRKGLRIVKNAGTIKSKDATILIPSHGASPGLMEKIGLPRINTTCPLVGRVQDIVRDLKKKGYFIIIVGNEKHPEVKGLVGIASKKNCMVVRNKGEAKSLSLKKKKVALLSQTTASLSAFKEVVSEVAKKDFLELVSFNTVCRNTIERQREAEHIARGVDSMIVIGGKQSANTTKLAKVCKNVNKNTFHIESERDLKDSHFRNRKRIGIATGASTPPYAICGVIKKIKED